MVSNQPDPNATVSIFALEKVVATRGAYEALQEAGADPAIYLRRHECGDWGEVDAEDAAENDRSIGLGLRILSAYTLTTGVRIWIITEADQSYTTVMLPEEYRAVCAGGCRRSFLKYVHNATTTTGSPKTAGRRRLTGYQLDTIGLIGTP